MAAIVTADKVEAPEVPPVPDEATPEPTAAAATADTEDENISEEQMKSTVVVTGMPKLDHSDLRKGMDGEFMDLGNILRVVFQDDEQNSHAVVVLETPAQAQAVFAAAQENPVTICGNTVGVLLAVALEENEGGEGAAKTEGTVTVRGKGTNKIFAKAKAGAVAGTAGALVIGAKAAKNLRSFDNKHKISKNVGAAALAAKAKAMQIDDKLGISQSVKKAASDGR